MNDADLIAHWQAAWPGALATWSRFTRLRDPRLCTSRLAAAEEGLSGSFAMIRLADQSVVIDLESVRRLELEQYALEVLAHEIGHHVLAPGSATDQFRLLARIRKALPTLEKHAPLVANLYTDLFINDRLQRQGGLRMADIYRRLAASTRNERRTAGVWTLYMRVCEHLWQLERDSLGGASEDARLDGDAWLGARLVRAYANEWLLGAGRFATLLLPYLVADIEHQQALALLHDTQSAAEGSEPYGALDIDPDEEGGAIHPAEDPRVTGAEDDQEPGDPARGATARTQAVNAGGQAREPYQYGEIVKAAGIKLSDHEIAVRYYRERALPHLVPFPVRTVPDSPEPQLEGLEPWDIGDPFDEVDWLQTILQSPRPIPGMTTVRRQFGLTAGARVALAPVDLDMYVDSSGSMPNPQQQTSFLALAGAIIALSALRAGSAVQATLWSGKGQYSDSGGFVRDENAILRVLTGFYGGGTCFPIHRLRETYEHRDDSARPVHILQISDDGITTMFDKDERGNSGWDVSAQALARARGGGTMALNIGASCLRQGALARAATEQGWDIHPIARMEDLLAFARAFATRHYASITIGVRS